MGINSKRRVFKLIVKNLNGTSDNLPPKPYSSWKAWWEDKKGRNFMFCSCSDCLSPASVGAHAQKVSKDDKKWYIIPLCTSCNNKSSDEEFSVQEADLEAVND